MDPLPFGKLDQDLHQSGKQDSDPHQSETVDPDPHQSGKVDSDLHESEKMKALRGSFWSIGGSKYGKASSRIRIRIKLKGRIRIRMTVKRRIRIDADPQHWLSDLCSER